MKFTHRTSLSDFKAQVRKVHAETKQKAAQDARFYAEEGKPDVNEDDLRPYVSSLVCSYDLLEAEAENITQANSNKAQGTIEREEWEEKNSKLDQEIKDHEHDKKRVKHAKESIVSSYPWDRYPLVKAAVYICSGFEALVSRSSFQVLGQSVGASYLIALGFAFIMALLAEFTAKLIKSAKTPQELKIRIGASIVIMAGFFFVLTRLRLMFLHLTNTFSPEMEVSPIYFVLLNLVFFAVSVSVAYFYMPEKEEMQARDKERKLEKELAAIDRKIGKLKEEKLKEERKCKDSLKDRAASIMSEESLKKWIQSLKNETIQEFISVNIRYRKTRMSNCFKQKTEYSNH